MSKKQELRVLIGVKTMMKDDIEINKFLDQEIKNGLKELKII
jgi:hypothetical protein